MSPIAFAGSKLNAASFVFNEPFYNRKTESRAIDFVARLKSVKGREGALAGEKPEHAFFVNVGLGTTMTAQDILEGRMNVEIGMAAVRPAEFIILKFSHKMQES